jgi:hypothetical protein
MSAAATTVEIGFNLAANGVGNWFTLDDTVKGVLDNPTYLYAGDVLVDVTSSVRKVQISRSRSRQQRKTNAATCQIELDNRTRLFDPTYPSSPYYGGIVPRKQVQVTISGAYAFVGNVEDWDLSYDLSGDSVAVAKCVDGFALLANQTLSLGTATAQATGARIGAYLTTLAWPTAARSIGTGQATLLADVITEGTNGLSYLQKVETSEADGALFVSRSGAMTFRDRSQTQAYSGVAFGTDGIPFSEIEVQYGTETLYTEVVVTRSNGTATIGTATAVDTAGTASYGVTTLEVATILADATQATNTANYLVGKYGQPRYAIKSLGIVTEGLTADQVGDLLALELSDVVLVTWTPNNVGTALTQYLAVDGITHDISPGSHTVQLELSAQAVGFTLNSAVFGVLDQNIYGF